jgi:xylulokinase
MGFAGQMDGVVPIDDEARPEPAALLWPDQRARSVMARWESLPAQVRGRLANPLAPGMAGPMLTWLAEARPAEPRRGFRSPKDWLRSVLTGDDVTEPSDASATLLWDVVAGSWCDEALEIAGLQRRSMPQVVDSTAVVGATPWPLEVEADGIHPAGPGSSTGPAVAASSASAAALVVAGGADTACALTAIRARLPGAGDTPVVNLGSGVQVLRGGARPVARVEPTSHLYADCEGGWYEMQALQNGGLALSWAQRALGLTWRELVTAAAAAPRGARGARFVPFLTGERGGLAGPDSRGGWCGLTPSVGRAELARAALEALAFSVRWAVEEVLGEGAGEGVLLCGGGARDPWVRRLLADTLDRPVTYVALRSASAAGAAVLAARGAGMELAVRSTVVEVPSAGSPDLSAAYDDWRAAVRQLA